MAYDEYSRNNVREVVREGSWTARRLILAIFGLAVLAGILSFGFHLIFTPAAVIEKATDPDAIISNYEEFQNMWNSCQKIDSDLKTLCDTPDNDQMFSNFSKASLVNAKRQQMTRWVNEYNAKSKMWNRQYWKSASLPYQLKEEDFPNYNCNQKGQR